MCIVYCILCLVYCILHIAYCVLYIVYCTPYTDTLYCYTIFITLFLFSHSLFYLHTQGVTVFAVIIVVLVVSAVFYLQIFMTSPEQLDRFTINGFNATNIITSLLSAIAIAVSTFLSVTLYSYLIFLLHCILLFSFLFVRLSHDLFYHF